MLNCSNGLTYLGIVVLGASGPMAPNINGTGGQDSTFLIQQSLADISIVGSYPTKMLAGLSKSVSNTNYSKSGWPYIEGNILAANLWNGCPCPAGSYGWTYPQCMPCPAGAYVSGHVLM